MVNGSITRMLILSVGGERREEDASQSDRLYTFMLAGVGFLLSHVSCALSLYLSSAVQQRREPRGGSLLRRSRSHGHHWFCTQPEWIAKTHLYVDSGHRLVIGGNDNKKLNKEKRSMSLRNTQIVWLGKMRTNLSLTNMEVLIAVVDDVVLRAACSDETQSLKKQNKNRNDLHGSVLF